MQPASSRGHTTFLDDGVLSWEKVSALLTRGNVAHDFEVHLRSIAASCLSGPLQQRLVAFCDNEFKNSHVGAADLVPLDPSPAHWPLPSAGQADAPNTLLEKYPLRQPNAEGGATYYLVGVVVVVREFK